MRAAEIGAAVCLAAALGLLAAGCAGKGGYDLKEIEGCYSQDGSAAFVIDKHLGGYRLSVPGGSRATRIRADMRQATHGELEQLATKVGATPKWGLVPSDQEFPFLILNTQPNGTNRLNDDYILAAHGGAVELKKIACD
ncbi:MAG: hypothetical protein ABS98_06955 [Lysobacteraceae bacterium SCN 69-48]|jgi:hypothetical protein|nr:MAG: hypothetical protein ABS98_06955 [Xanthomonadaceae bacterium SCN 69-48]